MIVYFIQSSAGGPIKIGKSTNANRRLANLQTAHAERLLLLGTTQIHSEESLHQRFADLRLSGEWFRCDDRLAAWIWANAVMTPEGRLTLAKFWPT